ncbi:6-phosphogluconolactonase [Streptomyces sp. NPDC006132]|uniref:6-phosphogluconolactonase n=1 Tax=Streptomyces sp. NPDC006132 TaxID=3156732 RepID=UPI0033D4A22A
MELLTFDDSTALAESAAQMALQTIKDGLAENERVTWILTGGRTPGAAYRLIAGQPDAVDWSRVNIGMGDERCVALDDSESNWGQAERDLLRHLPLTAENLLKPAGAVTAQEAADHYELLIRDLPLASPEIPRLDLLWLGMGEDGHTLSLFPGLEEIEEASRLVASVYNSPKPPPQRATLTMKAMRGVKACHILVSGAGKADALGKALSEAENSHLPVARVAREIESQGGKVIWFVDKPASARL